MSARIWQRSLVYGLLALTLVACEGQATPFADLAQASPDALTGTSTPATNRQAQPLRYGVTSRLLPFLQDRAALGDVLLSSSEAPALDSQSLDVLVTLHQHTSDEAFPSGGDWQKGTLTWQSLLILNPELAPLNNQDVQSLLRQSLTSGVEALNTRQTLAALGNPDGFVLSLATPLELLDLAWLQRLALHGFELRPVQTYDLVNQWQMHHLSLVLVTAQQAQDWRERASDSALIEWAEWTPVYQVAQGLAIIGHTNDGLPIVERPSAP